MLTYVNCIFLLFATVTADEKLISDGSWRIIEIAPCLEDYEIWFNLTKYKLTRTKDVFDAQSIFPEDFDSSFSLHAEISKDTDGGWKDYSVITHGSVLEFCRNHSRVNHDKLFEAMGLDKDSEMIPKGTYAIKGFGFDHCNMPPQGILGVFNIKAYILNKIGIRIGCVSLIVEFKEEMDDCSGEEQNEE